MLDALTITVPGVPDDLRTPGTFVHISDTWQDGLPAPVAPGGSPTYADFTAMPLTGTAPLEVQFTDLSSTPRGAWAWDFGDGGTSTAQHPSHIYAAAGAYTVTLTATGPDGSDSKTRAAYIVVEAASVTGRFFIGADYAGTGGTANPRIGTPGGIWTEVTTVPAGWNYAGLNDGVYDYELPAALIWGGGDDIYVPAKLLNNSGSNAMRTADGGATWTAVDGNLTLWGTPPDWGGFILNKYVICYTTTFDFALYTSATGTSFAQLSEWSGGDWFAAGGMCEHKGQAYITLWPSSASLDLFIQRSPALTLGTWTAVGSVSNAWDNANIVEPYLAPIVSTGTRLVIMTGSGGVSYSDDDGATWSPIVQTGLTAVAKLVWGQINGQDVYVAVTGKTPEIWVAGPDLEFIAHTPASGVAGFTHFRDAAFGSGLVVITGDKGVVVVYGPSGFSIEDAGFPTTADLSGVLFIN